MGLMTRPGRHRRGTKVFPHNFDCDIDPRLDFVVVVVSLFACCCCFCWVLSSLGRRSRWHVEDYVAASHEGRLERSQTIQLFPHPPPLQWSVRVSRMHFPGVAFEVLISAIVSDLDMIHRELKHHTLCMFTTNLIPRLSRINQRVNRPTDQPSIFTTYRVLTLSRIAHTTTIQSANPATTTLTTIL